MYKIEKNGRQVTSDLKMSLRTDVVEKMCKQRVQFGIEKINKYMNFYYVKFPRKKATLFISQQTILIINFRHFSTDC